MRKILSSSEFSVLNRQIQSLNQSAVVCVKVETRRFLDIILEKVVKTGKHTLIVISLPHEEGLQKKVCLEPSMWIDCAIVTVSLVPCWCVTINSWVIEAGGTLYSDTAR